MIIYIIVVFNSDNYVPVLDNLVPIENITSFGQFCPNYGQLNIFTFNGTLFDYTSPFDYTYPLYYPYHKVDNYVLFSIHHQGGRHHHRTTSLGKPHSNLGSSLWTILDVQGSRWPTWRWTWWSTLRSTWWPTWWVNLVEF